MGALAESRAHPEADDGVSLQNAERWGLRQKRLGWCSGAEGARACVSQRSRRCDSVRITKKTARGAVELDAANTWY